MGRQIETNRQQKAYRRKDYRPMVGAGIGVALLLAWLLFGSTGLFAWSDYHRALLTRQDELAELKQEQARLVNRQHLLNPRHVDPDLADEMVRSSLNLIHPDDIVIPLK
ncbi:MAG: septum formation initiator family protein [Sphingopyxis sp.]